jgi:hypothetical protein
LGVDPIRGWVKRVRGAEIAAVLTTWKGQG